MFGRSIHGRNELTFDAGPAAVPAGSRLRFRWYQYDLGSQGARYLFAGETYGDSGITLTLGHFE